MPYPEREKEKGGVRKSTQAKQGNSIPVNGPIIAEVQNLGIFAQLISIITFSNLRYFPERCLCVKS